MPIDTFMIMALADELSQTLEGGRIDKIHMPARDEIHLLGRSTGGTFRLLLSGGTRYPRVHLSTVKRENPAVPAMFCMLLRKHLTGGRFLGLYQPAMERVLHLHWSAADELGVISRKTLICEMMGKHSNIILADNEGRIIDCLRRVDNEMSPERPVLPGLFYRDPPRQNKQNPITMDREAFEALWKQKPFEQDGADWLLDTFSGLSPVLCRDLAGGALHDNFFALMEKVHNREFSPVLYHRIKKGEDVSVFMPFSEGEAKTFEGNFSELLDFVYTKREERDALGSRAQAIRKQAENVRDRISRKLFAQEREWNSAREREPLRECGDLLMANLHRMERGLSTVTLEDFYHDNAPRVISLDTTRSAQQNAALYYKRYAKAKTAEIELQKQIETAKREIEYWESVIEQISRAANMQELREIQEELHPPRGKQKLQKLSVPHAFVSSEGIRFWAGRNNRQNDVLTMKSASKNDIWMHTQKIPGCHVIVDTGGGEPSEKTLYEAAAVAAWYSGAKTSPKVSVDYTRVKYVKKPAGAKPGFVVYERFKTLLVEPDEKLAERLREE